MGVPAPVRGGSGGGLTQTAVPGVRAAGLTSHQFVSSITTPGSSIATPGSTDRALTVTPECHGKFQRLRPAFGVGNLTAPLGVGNVTGVPPHDGLGGQTTRRRFKRRYYTAPFGVGNLTGVLSLDDLGDPDTPRVFQMPGSPMLSPGSPVQVTNGSGDAAVGDGVGPYSNPGSFGNLDTETTLADILAGTTIVGDNSELASSGAGTSGIAPNDVTAIPSRRPCCCSEWVSFARARQRRHASE